MRPSGGCAARMFSARERWLYEALKPSGLRTPYWGTLSGLKATVGGSLSQNSIFWGSGQFGTAAENVLGMEVVDVFFDLVVYDFEGRRQEFVDAMAPMIASGAVKVAEDVAQGLEQAPAAFCRLMCGENRGKAVVKVK